MSEKKKGTVDMLNGSLMKNIWLFAIPLMFTNFMQTMFQAADQVIVGKFAGQQALAAVGATGSLCFLIISLFSGLSMGSNVIIARYLGAGNEERVKKAVHTTVTMALVCGVLLTILGYVLSRPMLELMSTPSDIIDMSTLYMRLYFFGSLFGITYFFGGSILRAKGDTKRPMYFLMVSGATNVVLNLIFVIAFKMGVAGVAWATVISQAIGAGLVIATLCTQKDVTHLDIKKLGIDAHVAWEIIRIGVPAGLQSMVFSLSNVVVQSSINSFGSSAIVAGNSAAANVEGFVYIGMQGFTQACMTFTSQNIGAKRYERIKEIMKLTMKLTLTCTAIISFAVWFFGEPILSLYTSDAEVVEVGMVRLTYVVLPLILQGLLDVIVSSMRGMGYSLIPTITMIIGICGVRLTWIATAFAAWGTLPVIYICYPLSWGTTSIIQSFFWKNCHDKVVHRAEA